MTKMLGHGGLTRRQALLAGAAGIAGTALASRAFADVIADAKIVAEGGMVDGAKYKKDGPYRIGFSNGFSGNTWRTECVASVQKEAKAHKDLADFFVVDGQATSPSRSTTSRT